MLNYKQLQTCIDIGDYDLKQGKKWFPLSKYIIIFSWLLTSFSTNKKNHTFSLAENTLPFQDEDVIYF